MSLKRKLLILALIIVFLGSVAALALYNLGDYVLETAFNSAITSGEVSSTSDNSKGSATNVQNGANTGQSSQAQDSDKQTIDAKKMKEIVDKVPATEKIDVSRMVLSRLSAGDIKYLKGLMAGGLTAKERAEAKRICYSRFTKAEIQQIYAYYNKYK